MAKTSNVRSIQIEFSTFATGRTCYIFFLFTFHFNCFIFISISIFISLSLSLSFGFECEQKFRVTWINALSKQQSHVWFHGFTKSHFSWHHFFPSLPCFSTPKIKSDGSEVPHQLGFSISFVISLLHIYVYVYVFGSCFTSQIRKKAIMPVYRFLIQYFFLLMPSSNEFLMAHDLWIASNRNQ